MTTNRPPAYSKALVALLLLIAPVAQAAPTLPDLPIPECFGVNTHFLNEHLSAQTDTLKKSNLGWIRRDLYWDAIERHPGVYDFSAYDRLVDAAQDAHLRILFILDYGNTLYDDKTSPVTAESRAAFAKFAATAAKRYADKNVVWEIYNEPNWVFWKPKPDVDQYIALANELTAAIRQAVPDALIVGPALAGPTTNPKTTAEALAFLDKVFKSPAAREWSAITVHPYRDKKASPETAEKQLAQIRQMMRENGLDPQKTPLIAGEWGYSTWIRGVDEETQAAYAVRELLGATTEHMPFTIWYDWQDDGPNAFDPEYRFGLLRAGSLEDNEGDVEKPAFVAVQKMSELLRGYRFTKIIDSEPTTRFLAFNKGATLAYALWADNTAQETHISLPEGHWIVTPLLDTPYDLTATKAQKITLQANSMPTIITKAE